MGKTRYVYNLFSAAQLKARADIPADPTDITVVDDTIDYIDCVNIESYDIADLLVVDRETGMIQLFAHANVNRWSCWGPTIRSLSGSGWTRDLVNSAITQNCDWYSWAGYNHEALTPGWQTGGQATAQADKWVDYGSPGTIECPICIGEIDWHDIGALWVVAILFNAEDGVAGWSKVDVESVSNNFTIWPETTDNILLDHTDWYGRLVFCDSAELATPEDVEAALLCRVPNTATFDVNFKVKLPSSVYYSSTGTTQPPSPWVNNNGALGMNWSTGIVTIGYDLETNNTYANVQFQATLYNWLDEVIGQGDIFNAAYSPLDSVYGSVDLGMASIPAYGYKVVVDIFYTL